MSSILLLIQKFKLSLKDQLFASHLYDSQYRLIMQSTGSDGSLPGFVPCSAIYEFCVLCKLCNFATPQFLHLCNGGYISDLTYGLAPNLKILYLHLRRIGMLQLLNEEGYI